MLRLAAGRLAAAQPPLARALAAGAAPPQGEESLVARVAREQLQRFKALSEGAKAIPPPLDGDEAAVAKFQAAYDALRKKVGVASTGERLRNSLAAAREGAPTVRAFLTASAELRAAAGVPDSKGVDAALMAAVDKAEAAAGGAPLLFSDAKGLAALKAAAAAIADKAGLKGASVAALEAAAAKEEAANLVGSVKAARDGAVEMTKARDGLAYL